MFELKELRSYMIDENLGVYEMLQEIPQIDEFNQHNEFYGLDKQQTKSLINKKEQYANGINNDIDNPKCEHFVLFADRRPVVIGGLMLEIDDYWKQYRGHFWLKTRPSERQKGYGTKFLELILERAKKYGINEFLGQCNKNNIASNKIMQNNGMTIYINPLCPNRNDTNFYKKFLKTK